jgi:hypothetical protein
MALPNTIYRGHLVVENRPPYAFSFSYFLARVSFISYLTPKFMPLALRVGYTDSEIRKGFSTRKTHTTRFTYTHADLRIFHTRKYVRITYLKHYVTQKC